MTEPEKPKGKKPKPKRRWLRLFAIGFFLSLLLFLVFYQSIVSFLIHAAAVRIAQRENIQLAFKVDGDFLTSLAIRDLTAYPTGSSPIDAIEIERAEFHYSFWKLATKGLSEFLDSYQLHNTSIVISPVKGTEEQKHELANLLQDILAQPALFSDRIEVTNFSLTVHTDDGDFRLDGLNASLSPEKTGFIRVSEVAIPKIVTWNNLSAVATYRGRHLIARDFDLGKEIHVTRVELDSSQRASGVNYLSLEGNVMGGDVGIFLWRRATGSETDAVQFSASVRNFDMAELRNFLRWKPEVSGKIREAWIELNGDPDVPASWNGSSIIKAEAMRFDALRIDEITGGHQVTNGAARFSGVLSSGKNRLDFQSEHRLPETIDKLFNDGFKAAIELNAPELPRLSKDLTKGNVKGSGFLQIERGRVALTFEATGTGIEGRIGGVPASLASVDSRFHGNYNLVRRPPGTPWFDGFTAQIDDRFTNFQMKDAVIDSASFSARLEKGVIELSSAELQRGKNTANFSGEMRLPNGEISWENLNADLRFDVKAPTLNEIAAETLPDGTVRGALSATGDFSRKEGKTIGSAKIEATDLAYKEFSARRLALDLPIEDGVAYIKDFELDLDGTDKITGKGSIGLNEPFAYEATLNGKLRDLSVFQPIFKRPLAGSLEIDWRGSGQLHPGRHTGEGRATMHQGKIDNLTGIEAEIAGFYSPEKVDLPTFKVRSNQGAVDAIVSLRDSLLKIAPLRVEVGKRGVVTGSVSIPLDLRTPEKRETIFPKDSPIDAQLTLQEIDLEKLLPAPPPTPPREKRRKKGEPAEAPPPSAASLGISGRVNAKFTATGTPALPEMGLDIQLRDLKLRSARALQPSAVDASIRFKDNELTLSGTARIPTASPLSFRGKMPFDLRKVIIEGAIDPETPIEFSATMPPTSANAFAQFLPMVRYAQGEVSINALVKGTIRNPILDGGVRLNLNALRFQDAALPGISNFRANIGLAGNEIIVRQFSGEASGGPFSLTGKVILEPLGPPVLDLRFRSQGTLLLRNDAVIVRADSDIRIAGPFQSANVTGKIGINRSRFFREIEILPLGLPGRPSAQPAPMPPTKFSIDVAPFRDWSFDVAIKTTEPFIIRSNLASGQAYADLKLGGTGLAPTVEGTARIENFIASLPFSRLEVNSGYLYFTGDPMNPTIDIQGSSRIRNYNIHVTIYGTASEPQTVFSSEPPLPQEEIIALLATGATTQEFSEDGTILAGRAAVLLLQDLYHKIFRRQRAPATAATGQREFMERFHLDVGSVDPRTGRQQVSGRFTLSRQFEIAAGVDLEGDVRVELRYLIRFR